MTTSSARRTSVRPVLLAACGVTVLWALVVAMGAFYFTTPGELIGRINDFLQEAYPALRLLYQGHLDDFLRASPAYVGSLILRAPFALVAEAAKGSWQTVYAVSSLPCLAAAPILGAWLARTRRVDDPSAVWTWFSPFGLLLVINPLLIFCLVQGHPEDVLGASLAIAGVVQASRGKPVVAMFLVGIAVFNKPWALVAAPVAFVALPGQRVRGGIVFSFVVGVAYLPVLVIHLLGTASGSASAALGVATGSIFQFPQLWWWFGPHDWISVHAHELIVIAATVSAAAWWRWRSQYLASKGDREREALLLLAFVFLLRAAMDPWDNIYYQLPFVMAIYAIEIRRPPRVGVLLTLILCAVTVPLHNPNFDLRAAIYQCAVVPMLLALALRVYFRPELWRRLVDSVRADIGQNHLRRRHP